jgi:hypothetical protein
MKERFLKSIGLLAIEVDRMSTKKKPLFEKVNKPIIERAEQTSVYTQLIEDIENQQTGWYKINTDALDIKPLSAYSSLSKRLKDRPNLKLHLIGKKVYIEKLS